MPLLLGQLIYTSFPVVGFHLLASAEVPGEVQQAFIQGVAHRYWNSYNPPKKGYRAAYVHQVTPEHTLFGWLYNDEIDEFGRSQVPYFVCYYLARSLHSIQLESIFSCLHKGPVALIDRQNFPASLETIVAPDLRSDRAARPGVMIPSDIREQCFMALGQGKLIDLCVPIDQREIVINLNEYSSKQEKASLVRETPPSGFDSLLMSGGGGTVSPCNDRASSDDFVSYTHSIAERINIDAAQLNSQDANAVIATEPISKDKYLTYASILEKAAQLEHNSIVRSAPLKDVAGTLFSRRKVLFWRLGTVVTVMFVALIFVSLKSWQSLVLPIAFSSNERIADEGTTPGQTLNPTNKLQPFNSKPSAYLESGKISSENKQDTEVHSIDVNIHKNVPGFPPGTPESIVKVALGKPNKIFVGDLQNNNAALYNLVPHQITLSYLFDRHSKRIRQTEVFFDQSIDSEVMLATLNGMLGGKATKEVQQGLQQVRKRQFNQYSFVTGSFQGIIKRNDKNIIYIGIWDKTLNG